MCNIEYILMVIYEKYVVPNIHATNAATCTQYMNQSM